MNKYLENLIEEFKLLEKKEKQLKLRSIFQDFGSTIPFAKKLYSLFKQHKNKHNYLNTIYGYIIKFCIIAEKEQKKSKLDSYQQIEIRSKKDQTEDAKEAEELISKLLN